MTASDHLSNEQFFYRLHPQGRPFTAADAFSQILGGVGEKQRGSSSFSDPAKLREYFNSNRLPGVTHENEGHPVLWTEPRDVLKFKGKRVGTGVDDEDLVVPDESSIQKIGWKDLGK